MNMLSRGDMSRKLCDDVLSDCFNEDDDGDVETIIVLLRTTETTSEKPFLHFHVTRIFHTLTFSSLFSSDDHHDT